MNMISTGAFLTEMDASNKQPTVAEKFAAVWEKKNAKAARAGGVSLMALSLAACGSSSTTTTTTTTTDTTPAVDPVESQALTDGLDILDAGNDNVFAGELTLTSGDRVETTGYVELDLSAVTIDGQTIIADNVKIDASGGVTIDASDWSVSNVEVEDSTGSVTINDIQSAGTALHADDVVDAAATLTYNFDAQAVAGSADNVSLTVSEVTAAVAVTGGNVETLTVNIADVSTDAESTLADLTATGNTTLVITGGAATYDFTVTDELDAALTTVDGSAALSDLNLDMGESTTTMTVSGGAGADVLDMGNTLGALDEQDTLDGNDGADQMTADFTDAGTRNPISTEIETYNLTYTDSATLDFSEVDDVATINIAESAAEVSLIDMDNTVTAINVSDDQTGSWDIDYETGEDATLTVTWSNNSDAADTVARIAHDEVLSLTYVGNGDDNITITDFDIDAADTETLVIRNTNDGDMNFAYDGDLNDDAADGDIDTTDAVINMTIETTDGGEIFFGAVDSDAAENDDDTDIVDLGALERLTVTASTNGDIHIGNLGTTTAAAELERVDITTAGADITIGTIDAVGATISQFNITAADDSTVTIDGANGEDSGIDAEDISEMTITIEQDATVNIEESDFTVHGDTLTVSGEGTLARLDFSDEAFATMNFSGLTTNGVTVTYSNAAGDVTLTGTGEGDTVVTGTGTTTATLGAGADDITVTDIATVTLGGGADTVTYVDLTEATLNVITDWAAADTIEISLADVDGLNADDFVALDDGAVAVANTDENVASITAGTAYDLDALGAGVSLVVLASTALASEAAVETAISSGTFQLYADNGVTGQFAVGDSFLVAYSDGTDSFIAEAEFTQVDAGADDVDGDGNLDDEFVFDVNNLIQLSGLSETDLTAAVLANYELTA